MSILDETALYASWLEEQEAAIMLGAAEHVEGGGKGPITFPATLLRIRVELQIGPFGIWTDITPYVLWRDKIRITRGRRNEQSTAPASTCALTLKNGDRRFSPRNVNGPWYKQFGRNTKMRVWLNPGSGDSLRFTGEIPDWSPKWITGNARTVAIQASGMMRRFEQGDDPALSAMRRSYRADVVQPVAYWPLEGGRDADVLYDAITGAPSETGGFAFTDGTAGVARFGVGDLGPGSDLVADISGGWNLDLNLPLGITATGEVTLEFSVMFGTTVRSGTYSKCGIRLNPQVAASHIAFNVFINDSGLIEVQWFEADAGLGLLAGPTTVYSAGSENIFDGQPRVFHLDLAASGGTNVAWSLYENDTLLDSNTITPSFSGAMNAAPFRAACVSTTGADDNSVMGHVAVYTTNIAPDRYTALTGHRGETPTDRFARICMEEGISYVIGELVVDTEGMGPQGIESPFALLSECEQTSEGLIDETREGALRLSSRTARWVPDVLLMLDYAHATYGNQVYDIDPTDDDFALVNDWTISRDGGASAQAEQTDGPLNVNAPEDDPEGVNRKRDSATLSLEDDTQPAQHAHWRLRKGTVDELRYPAITIALHRNPELIPGWLAMDINGRLGVLNPPADVGPDTIAQYAEGYTEDFDQFTWEATVNASPVTTGEAWRYNDVTGSARYDCAGSTLTTDHDSSTTSLSLTITDNCVWRHAYGDFTITVGGEDMIVTAAGSASGSLGSQAQTLTVTRSTNGAVLSHTAGTPVRLKNPARYAL